MRLPDGYRSRAVLLGTSRYEDPNLTVLPAVRNNLADLAAVLTSPDGTGLPAANCSVLPDETDVAVLGNRLDTAAAQAQDLLLVYYAGHGVVDAGGNLYLTLPRTRRDEPRWTGLLFSHLRDVILESPAANKVLVLDCLISGRGVEFVRDPWSVVSEQVAIPGTCTLTSASADEVSHAPPGARHTAYTGQLLDVLRSGTSDSTGLLTLSVIHQELVRSSAARGMARPEQRGTSTAVLLALAPNRRGAPPRPLAPAVDHHVPDVAQQQARSQAPDELGECLLTAVQVRDAVFKKPAIGKRGYHEQEVDSLLDVIEADLAKPMGQQLALSPEDVRNVSFSKPRMGKRGYDEDDVDGLLDLVERELSRRRDLARRLGHL